MEDLEPLMCLDCPRMCIVVRRDRHEPFRCAICAAVYRLRQLTLRWEQDSPAWLHICGLLTLIVNFAEHVNEVAREMAGIRICWPPCAGQDVE